MRYAQYFNGKKGLIGHLWKGRFLSCMLDDRSVFEEVRFIENNPVRARLVTAPEDYPWSSARHHILGDKNALIGGLSLFKSQVQDWSSYLSDRGDTAILGRNWRCLKTGRPAGDSEWIHNLESILGRRLEALPHGRPKKKPESRS
jgi:putative transposase